MPQTDLPEPIVTVCGGKMTPTPEIPQGEYRGQTVYFCHKACLRAFLHDPDRFIAGEIPHPDPD